MELSFSSRKTPEIVFDYLTNMQKFAAVNPVITAINITGVNSYEVNETLRLGFIPFSFSYPIAVESNVQGKTVIMRATVMKLTNIELTFSVHAGKEFTIIKETVRIKSFLPIVFVIKNIFRKQHTQLFKNIEMTAD